MRAKIFFLTAILGLFCASVFIEVGNAQTRRKKTTKPKATPTPYYSSNSVEIISLANQTDEQPQQQNNTNNQSQDEKPVENDSQSNATIAELNERISQLESKNKTNKEDKQKILLMNLDILTRAEQRADSLRKQLFEIIEKQNTLQGRLDQINYDLTPDQIERYSATIGSLRPELVREARKKTLENEKRNIESLLTQITTTRTRLEQDVERADFMVDKLRVKLEKEIDDALEDK